MDESNEGARPGHVPVLLDEVLGVLSPGAGETLLDCTAGLGGHASAIAARLGASGRVVLCDLDAGNLARAEEAVRRAGPGCEVTTIRANFAEAPSRLVEMGVRADLVLADLGFASTQVDDPSRGLSFRRDGPLDMRFDTSAGMTAADIVAMLGESELAEIIRRYGEERAARAVARKLVAARESAPITTTGRLASLVREVVGRGGRDARIDPATRTFQALRIVVNDELGNLRSLLSSVEAGARSTREETRWVSRGARIAVISFHSLEDRLVKDAFRRLSRDGLCEVLTRRPLSAGEDEAARNPRARSARLRAIRLPGESDGS